MIFVAAILCGALYLGAFALMLGDAVEAAVIAGVFSVVNTMLNILLVRRQAQALTKLEGVEVNAEAAAKVAEIIPLRKGDLSEEYTARRETDGVDE